MAQLLPSVSVGSQGTVTSWPVRERPSSFLWPPAGFSSSWVGPTASGDFLAIWSSAQWSSIFSRRHWKPMYRLKEWISLRVQGSPVLVWQDCDVINVPDLCSTCGTSILNDKSWPKMNAIAPAIILAFQVERRNMRAELPGDTLQRAFPRSSSGDFYSDITAPPQLQTRLAFCVFSNMQHTVNKIRILFSKGDMTALRSNCI